MQAYGHKPLRECRAAKAKQDPQEKATRSALRPDGKRYFSYADIHTAIASAAERVKVFNPDVMVSCRKLMIYVILVACTLCSLHSVTPALTDKGSPLV